jgi:anti-anti-sigma factor
MTLSTGPTDVHRLGVETNDNQDAAWVILHGEADIATLQHLEAALTRIELDGAKPVHLHVADLDFADVATLQLLTAFARQAKQVGHDVKTCGASPTLRKVARLMSVHDDLGLS